MTSGRASSAWPARATARARRKSGFDAAAPSFDSHRPLPDGVAEAIRAALLRHVAAPRPRLLDLGVGTGRIGRAFVTAGDDYVATDLSFGMLRQLAMRVRYGGPAPRLVQADGEHLPFSDAAFDGVMLIQVFGGMRGWRRLVGEARRVLRPGGALLLGRTVTPEDGVDAQMKRALSSQLEAIGQAPGEPNPREDVERSLQAGSQETRVVAAMWTARRTPRAFLDRHRTGARFSMMPEPVKEEALARLGAWAAQRFGSLDVPFQEQHVFELLIYRCKCG